MYCWLLEHAVVFFGLIGDQSIHNAIPFTCFCRACSPNTPFLIFPLVPDCSGSSLYISNALGFFRWKEAGAFLKYNDLLI